MQVVSPLFFQLNEDHMLMVVYFVFKCAFFIFLLAVLLWSPSFLVSLFSLFSKEKKKVGKHEYPGKPLVLYLYLFRPVSVLNKPSGTDHFWDLNVIINAVLCNRLLTGNLSWLTRRTDCVVGWRTKRSRGAFRSSNRVPQKSE